QMGGGVQAACAADNLRTASRHEPRADLGQVARGDESLLLGAEGLAELPAVEVRARYLVAELEPRCERVADRLERMDVLAHARDQLLRGFGGMVAVPFVAVCPALLEPPCGRALV